MGACVVTVESVANAPIFQCSIAVSVWRNCGVERSQTANSAAAPCPSELRLSFGAGLSGKLLVALFAYEEVLFIHAGWNRDVEKADHHFVIGLLAPAHFETRIRIVRVRLGVVV